MSVAEIEDQRTVRELQAIFKKEYDKKVNSEKRISECDQGFQNLRTHSQSALNYAQKFKSSKLNEQINSIKSSGQHPQSLDDPKLIELKQSLNSLFEHCDTINPRGFTVSSLEKIADHPKSVLLKDEQFAQLTKDEQRVAQQFEEVAEPIKNAHLQRVVLGQQIETEKQRVLKKRRFVRNSIIVLLLAAGGFAMALKENDPQLFEQYLNIVKGMIN
ncbi:hypothetical protein [Vibrio panuliri]|uniref:Uncharacterized protein n=1 Tax=Vibrio panuliri TaxID=1381081 RepID=A0A1Q9HES8_9VIBR|nr:hypothetical protein [Vibrio panuliri]KAB1454617.1 hypothetical protein F7O85_17275 [Vibrio panuliri]OLQ88227.1 hypothetical protein BIY22_08665 [Vibrio panuliri]OLQ90765.1 hypothetical protein BIY20_10475 [Vibrio panuliri]